MLWLSVAFSSVELNMATDKHVIFATAVGMSLVATLKMLEYFYKFKNKINTVFHRMYMLAITFTSMYLPFCDSIYYRKSPSLNDVVHGEAIYILGCFAFIVLYFLGTRLSFENGDGYLLKTKEVPRKIYLDLTLVGLLIVVSIMLVLPRTSRHAYIQSIKGRS
jgi:hypothetical protein